MRRPRMIVGAIGLLLTVASLVWAVTGLPSFGDEHHRYGAIVARDALPQRSATNSVVATAFDYRALDTLGEEFILFISVIAVMVLLRALREEQDEPEKAPPRAGLLGGESERRLGASLVGLILVLGAYIVTHGQLTPGGGFQGGVVLASGIAFLFIGGQYLLVLRLRRGSSWLELADAAGAAGFAIIGFGGLVAGGAFFFNFIPKGSSGLLTGGMIPLANMSVGMEVAGAVLMVLSELCDRRLLLEGR
jgi:multicomponent Na+:H+ antiporter subunit B